MFNIINSIIDDKIFLEYDINIGYYNEKKKVFCKYINKKYFYTIKNNFKNFKYKRTKYKVNKFKNKNKIENLRNGKIIYTKNKLAKYKYFKNNIDTKNYLNYSYLLIKEMNYDIIGQIEFPNIKEDIIEEEKIVDSYIFCNKKSKIKLNFEIINENNFNINLKFNFDSKIKNDVIDNLNNIFNKIYPNLNFSLLN